MSYGSPTPDRSCSAHVYFILAGCLTLAENCYIIGVDSIMIDDGVRGIHRNYVFKTSLYRVRREISVRCYDEKLTMFERCVLLNKPEYTGCLRIQLLIANNYLIN